MPLNTTLYKSARFIVAGNIGLRIVITDLHEDKAYEIQYHELIKFRRYYNNLKPENRDLFLLATITPKKGIVFTKTEPVVEKVA